MKILFLDDDEERHDAIEKWLAGKGHSITHVRNSQQCIDKLNPDKFTWDLVMLDHDLGEVEGDDGRRVCRWIAELGPRLGGIVVHSWNAPAGREMMQILEESITNYYEPCRLWFGSTEFKTFVRGL